MKSHLLTLAFLVCSIYADGPADNAAEKVRPVPPPGMEIPSAVREDLTAGLKELESAIEGLQRQTNAVLPKLLPDVLIYRNAIHYALTYNEFLRTNDFSEAPMLLKEGLARAKSLGEGTAPWHSATGLVARGYVSKIDGSVQPYGLVVPLSYGYNPTQPHRLDIWFHGRDEKLNEIKFLYERHKSAGQFVPPNTFVLHLYGRYCNANKLAGEVDLFEAMEDVKKHYRIDDDRIVVRGFSMGGAACWQFAVHYPGLWAAAAPGAGFSETPEFLNVFQNEKVDPPWWEQKLWHIYNCNDYAINLFNLPTVAYSGEKDKQKQAADVMARALAKEGMNLTHVIGPNTGHEYQRDAKKVIDQKIDALASAGRATNPKEVRFATWTLRYNQSRFVKIDGMEEHWKEARIVAEVVDESEMKIEVKNIAQFTIEFGPGESPFGVAGEVDMSINGEELTVKGAETDRSWKGTFQKSATGWELAGGAEEGLRKAHGLQGPIDDAFMDSFYFVVPTGVTKNSELAKWTQLELDRAVTQWRKQFRGEARVIKDSEVTDAIRSSANLVLWGNAESNQELARVLEKLPVKWDAESVSFGSEKYAANNHVPLMVYPNPLNPKRYVVLNSGFTFREYDNLNNARQIPKLPDWAVLDISVPPNSRYAGKVVTAGFFDERWQLKK